jgi:hypothetical protein
MFGYTLLHQERSKEVRSELKIIKLTKRTERQKETGSGHI